MYYIQARYYDPIINRFLNADDERLLLFNNNYWQTSLFNYCLNCPVNYMDICGKIAITISLCIGAAISLLKILAGMVFLYITTAILLDPAFQKALAKAIDKLGTRCESLINDVVKTIDTALTKAKNKSVNKKYEKHHIVPKNIKKNIYACKSRDLLEEVAIGIDSTHNTIYIKYNLHKHIHTDLYCLAVYMFLKFKKGSRDGILTCLNLIKNALKAASDNCP